MDANLKAFLELERRLEGVTSDDLDYAHMYVLTVFCNGTPRAGEPMWMRLSESYSPNLGYWQNYGVTGKEFCNKIAP